MVWEKQTLEKCIEKYRATAPRAKEIGHVPYIGGKEWISQDTEGNGWWTNGFWSAIMWQGYHATGDTFFLEEARRAQAMILPEMYAYYPTSHDLGFMYLISCGADYKLTGDESAKRETLLAANLLAGRFNPAGFIRAWNGAGREGWAIVDCLMNLPLLYAASAMTDDPRYAAIARIHTDTAAREMVRGDGSCEHIVCFDPYTGKKLAAPAGQGCAAGSSWSRGQAWALYGFTLSYLCTGEKKYLFTARRVADYFITQLRADGLTACDFRQPESEDLVDNIAAACAACGLIELERITGCAEYRDAALTMLRALDALCADYSHDTCGILTRCTAAYDDHSAQREARLIYGDYFYIEALAKLAGSDPMLWLVK